MIVIRMSKGLSEAERGRIWHEVATVRGPDRRLVGTRYWLDTDVIEVELPTDLDLREHYAVMIGLNSIKGVAEVYRDNGARAEPGGGQPSVRHSGGIREFIRGFVGAFRFSDL